MKKYTLSQTKRKYNLLRVIFFCLFPALCIMGSDRKMIHVKDIQLHIKDGNLIVSAQCVNLFSKKCISTLQSGVTSVVHVDMELVEEGILTTKQLDGVDLRFGNDEAVIEMIDRIVFRKGWLAFAEKENRAVA